MDSDESSPSSTSQKHGPQVARGRSLYPTHLSRSEASAQDQKRVPLHRRGKSRTYERLEDLLREAGYAETRIFTPEAERLEAQAERKEKDRRARGTRAGTATRSENAGGIISFLAGLVGGGAGRKEETTSGEDPLAIGSRPPETLSWGRAQGRIVANTLNRRESENIDPPTPTPKTRHRPNSRPTTAPGHGERKPFTPVIITTPPLNSPNSSDSKFTSNHSANLRASSSSTSLSPPFSSPMLHQKPQSRATAALRHMMSTPNIPRRDRPHSSYAQPPSAVRRSSELVGHAIHRHSTMDSEAPMPSNWLQTVAQAVLGTGPESGAYVGGPRGRSQHVNTNKRRDISTSIAAPHELLLTPSTPKPAMGLITLASVTCHSAPGSRSSSLVRTSDKKEKLSRKNSTSKKRRNSFTRVPSLGVTTVELEQYEERTKFPFSSSANAYPHAVFLANETDLTDDDDDADPEPDFTALLMPARRQNSIRSLRKHLHNSKNGSHGLGRPSSVASFRAGSTSNINDDNSNSRPATSSLRRTLHARLPTDTDSAETRPVRQMGGNLDPDDSFEASLAQDLLRSRRGSVDEGDASTDWPGLLRANAAQGKKRERGAMPAAWRPWAQN